VRTVICTGCSWVHPGGCNIPPQTSYSYCDMHAYLLRHACLPGHVKQLDCTRRKERPHVFGVVHSFGGTWWSCAPPPIADALELRVPAPAIVARVTNDDLPIALTKCIEWCSVLVDGVRSARSGGSKSEQVKKCMDLEHCRCTGYTWSPLTWSPPRDNPSI
jgi:hypothetical protein